MLIEIDNKIVYRIHFKNCKIYLNSISGTFLSHNKNFLSIDKKANEMLLIKFNTFNWNFYKKSLSHIDFLIKYSPIFSKLINMDELNTIEFCNPEFSLIRNFIYCNNKEYFNVFETNYRDFAIKYDSEFDDCVKLVNEEM